MTAERIEAIEACRNQIKFAWELAEVIRAARQAEINDLTRGCDHRHADGSTALQGDATLADRPNCLICKGHGSWAEMAVARSA